MDMIMLVWVVLMLLGFAGSALYSGMETGAYTLNRIRLQIYAHEHDARALSLRRLIDDSTSLLSTLLIGNNVANYLGTASLAMILQSYALDNWQSIVLNTFIVTPILFVFGETLPKDLFAAHADRLMYRLSPVLVGSKRLFTVLGVVPLISGFTYVVMRLIGEHGKVTTFHPRRQVETLVQEGVGYGLLSDAQSAMVQRVLALSQRVVKQDMTPWRSVETLRADEAPGKLWDFAGRSQHSRFVVLDRKGQVVGVVNVMDALVHDRETTPAIEQLMEPAVFISAKLTTRAALERLRQTGSHLAIVQDAHEKPAGIVTVKDLVEPITGEISNW